MTQNCNPDSQALEILRTVFGYDSFRGQQQEVIDNLLLGGDALVLMPTVLLCGKVLD